MLDLIHRQRLLPVENRPLRRPLERLFTPTSALFKTYKSTPSTTDATLENIPTIGEERQQWRIDFELELSLLESTMVRIQMLRRSNALERERYAQSKTKILEKAQEIRSNTAQLHTRLEEAQKTMALRKEYDALSEKITSNRMLRTREDQAANLDKLTGEIAELEEEALNYKRTWAERREQFGRIVDEGRQMLLLIKDEKEEAERKEGMDGGADEQEGAPNTQGPGSTVATPRPGGNTPADGEEPADTGERLLPPSFRLHSPGATRSRAHTPAPNTDGDVEMTEATTSTPVALSHVTSEMEEGEAEDDGELSTMET